MKIQKMYILLILILISCVTGCQPLTVIDSPSANEQFDLHEEIIFSGYATDFSDGELGDNSLVWTSNIDGGIGIGTSFTRDDLSEGIHEITLTATNSLGETGKCIITLSIGRTILISDSSQLIEILNSMTYKLFSHSTHGHLPISEDIQIMGTVTVLADQIEVPEGCMQKGINCRSRVEFYDSYEADGISLFSDSFLILTNIKLRFRSLIQDRHPLPLPYGYAPAIRLMPPSDHECNDEEIWCDVDQVCYAPDPFCSYCPYCMYCLDLSPQECACRDENGFFSNGTVCGFWVSNDVRMNGICQDGECVIEGVD